MARDKGQDSFLGSPGAWFSRQLALPITRILNGSNIPGSLALLVAAQAILWTSGPLLFVDGMHLDTMEMVAWAHDWSLGYPKHPPLATWLVRLAIELPGLRIFWLLVLGQVAVGSTAFFVWRSVRLFNTEVAGAVAVICFLVSWPASIFSLQLNHNLVAMPFSAALLYAGLLYLNRPSLLRAGLLGLAGGLALLVKYETAFFHLTLLSLSIAVPRFRRAWRVTPVLVGGLLFGLCVVPHVLWDAQHGSPTLSYAIGMRPLNSVWSELESLNQLFDGLFVLLIGPALAFPFVRPLVKRPKDPKQIRLAILIAGVPVASLVIMSLATWQIIRQGWLLPLAPAIAIGIGVAIVETERALKGFEKAALRSMTLSIVQMAAFGLFIVGRSTVGSPIMAYSFDSSELAAQLSALWRTEGKGTLECLAIPQGSETVGLPVLLYLDPVPQVVKFRRLQTEQKLEPLPCGDKGGLAIVEAGDVLSATSLRELRLPHTFIQVSPELKLGSRVWAVEAFVLPTAANDLGGDGDASKGAPKE